MYRSWMQQQIDIALFHNDELVEFCKEHGAEFRNEHAVEFCLSEFSVVVGCMIYRP